MRFKSFMRSYHEHVTAHEDTWTPWFAWRPVVDIDGYWLWLTPVERMCRIYHGSCLEASVEWFYRKVGS